MDNLLLWVALPLLVVGAMMANTLIGRKNQIESAFSSVDVQLKKRFDLIPNLVAVCEKHMGYEEGVLKDLTATRTQALEGASDAGSLDASLSRQLRAVFALAENYPTLTVAESFTLLQRSLNEVEEQLSAARRSFNASVTAYNNACAMFPTNIVAKLMGYRTRAWFDAAEAERSPLRVWR